LDTWIPFAGLVLGLSGTALLVHLLRTLERELPTAEAQPITGRRVADDRPAPLAKAA
jgi:hypothetical protein